MTYRTSCNLRFRLPSRFVVGPMYYFGRTHERNRASLDEAGPDVPGPVRQQRWQTAWSTHQDVALHTVTPHCWTPFHNGNSPHCCSRGKRSCHRQDVQWSLFSVSLGLFLEKQEHWQKARKCDRHHSLLREFTLGPLAYLGHNKRCKRKGDGYCIHIHIYIYMYILLYIYKYICLSR